MKKGGLIATLAIIGCLSFLFFTDSCGCSGDREVNPGGSGNGGNNYNPITPLPPDVDIDNEDDENPNYELGEFENENDQKWWKNSETEGETIPY